MKKTLTVLLALVLVIAMSVAGTMAYLTSTDSVTNTFTVGNVAITLDELDTDNDDNKDDNVTMPDGTVRDKANAYKLIPGHEYVKDPIIHFQPKSEASWLFVKVENGIEAIEAATTIKDQITSDANGWTLLEGTNNVYYKSVPANEDDTKAVDYPVFGSFKLTSDADVADYANAQIKVTAYAIQKDGFESDVALAWTTVSTSTT